MVLDPDAVRRRASSIPGCRPVAAAASDGEGGGDGRHHHVVSFLVVAAGGEDRDPARVTVFADTGTVCVSRAVAWGSPPPPPPPAGAPGQEGAAAAPPERQPPAAAVVRHVFRRNVTELDAVERLLRFPPEPAPVDATVVGLADREERGGGERGGGGGGEEDEDGDERAAAAGGAAARDPLDVLRSEMELADVGVAILEGEKSKLERHLADLLEGREEEEQQQRRAALAAAEAAAAAAAAAAATASAALPAARTQAPPVWTPPTAPAAGATSASTSAGPATSRSSEIPSPLWSRNQKQPPNPPPPGGSSAIAAATASSGKASAPPAAAMVPIMTKDIGMEFQFSLSAASMKHVDQCMSDITRMNKLIRGVATNGRGTVFLYGNGGVAYTPSIPRPLHHKLSQLRTNTRMSSRPSYVSLGSKDRYYCSFHDGTYSVKGPKTLERELKRCFAPPQMPGGGGGGAGPAPPPPPPPPPVSVAFGGTWEAWFAVFGDGSWKFQGKIPPDLSDKLASRGDRGDLVRVTLGPSGEWFVKARNGRMWWGGLTDAADAAVQQLLASHELCFLDFGEDGSYFVSYD
jgi:hypothetical protein